MKFLTRKGYLIEEQGMTYLGDTGSETALGPLQQAACTYGIALGPGAGQKVVSFQTISTREPPPTPARCVNGQGFSLHAEVCCAGGTLYELAEMQGTINLAGTNWITSSWGAGNSWTGNSVVMNQSGTLIEGTGFANGLHARGSSPAIDRSASAPSNLASRWVEYQYQPSASYVTHTTLGAANDLGAFERQ